MNKKQLNKKGEVKIFLLIMGTFIIGILATLGVFGTLGTLKFSGLEIIRISGTIFNIIRYYISYNKSLHRQKEHTYNNTFSIHFLNFDLKHGITDMSK